MSFLMGEPQVLQLGWTLVHFLWQGLAIGVMTWVVVALCPRLSSRARYLILCTALLGCGLAPCVTWEMQSETPLPHLEPVITLPVKMVSVSSPPQQIAVSHLQPQPLPAGEESPPLAWSLTIQTALPYIVVLWWLGVIFHTLRLVYGWTQLQRMCASGRPVIDENWLERLSSLAHRLGIHRKVFLLESALVEIPTVIGWLRPIILVPTTFFTGLPVNEIEAILAHELAHIRRHDYLVNWVQIAIETVLFYHPVVWWLSRSIRQEREHCCDDLAVQIVGNKAVYANALASLEERRFPTAISLSVAGGSLLVRIRRLAGMRPRQSNHRWTLIGVGVLAVIALFAILFQAEKVQQAPQLLFVVDKKAINLSAQAQSKIILQIETAMLAINEDSDKVPDRFKGHSFTVKEIEGDGIYLRLTYPKAKIFSTAEGPMEAKEIYLNCNCYGNPLGYAPGGILLVTEDGHSTDVRLGTEIPLVNLSVNADLISHLPSQMTIIMSEMIPRFVNGANEKGLDPELRLVVAAEKGDLSELKALLSRGTKPAQYPGSDATLLFAAGTPEVAEFLLNQGIKVNAQNEDGDTALISICENDSGRRNQDLVAPTAEVLLKHGANPNVRGGGNWTPLILAKDGPTVNILVKYGADVHARSYGRGVLDVALDLGYRPLSYYQALAEHGLPIDNKENGLQLLVHTAGGEETDTVKWLLDRGVDPNGIDPVNQLTPLKAAAQYDAVRSARLLIAHGAKVDDETMNVAMDNKRFRMVDALWKSGYRNMSELSHLISQNAPVAQLETLLENNADPNPAIDKQVTPLALASELGNLDAVQLLLKHGANPNPKIEDKNALALLLLGIPSPPTDRPLSKAAWMGHDAIVQCLLRAGGKPDEETVRSAENGFHMWTEFYQSRPGNPPAENFYKIIQYLVDAGAVKDLSRERMADLLLYAPRGFGGSYDLQIIQILLKAGLDPTSKNAKGKSAIDIAEERYAKASDYRTQVSLLEMISLFKNPKRETSI